MKTGYELIKKLPPIIRKAVISNMRKQDKIDRLDNNFGSVSGVIVGGFSWPESKQGGLFWGQCYDKFKKL